MIRTLYLAGPDVFRPDGRVDAHGWHFEEFGLPLNLMLAVPAPLVVGDARRALARLREDLGVDVQGQVR